MAIKLFNGVTWWLLKQKIRRQFPQVRQISTADLASWLATDKPLVLLDTRTPAEYAVSHLSQAHWLDPNTQNLGAIDWTSETPIVTYCSVGYRSARIADRLQAAGYTNIRNLEGSIFQWANEGRPLYRNSLNRDEQPVQQVHPYSAAWGRLLNRQYHAYEPG